MGKKQKITLGILTAMPLFLHLWVLAGFLGLFSGLANQPALAPGQLSEAMAHIILPAAVGGILQLGLFVFYVWRLMSKPPGDSSAIVLWVLAMLFLGPLAMLFYWVQYIWPDDSPRPDRARRIRTGSF